MLNSKRERNRASKLSYNPANMIAYISMRIKLKLEKLSILLEENGIQKLKEKTWRHEVKEAGYRPASQSVINLETPYRRTTNGRGQIVADMQYYGTLQ